MTTKDTVKAVLDWLNRKIDSKVEAGVTIQTNLASTTAASFDGTANVTPGVTGTLAVTNGGTGATTAAGALSNLGAVSAEDLDALLGDTDTDFTAAFEMALSA